MNVEHNSKEKEMSLESLIEDAKHTVKMADKYGVMSEPGRRGDSDIALSSHEIDELLDKYTPEVYDPSEAVARSAVEPLREKVKKYEKAMLSEYEKISKNTEELVSDEKISSSEAKENKSEPPAKSESDDEDEKYFSDKLDYDPTPSDAAEEKTVVLPSKSLVSKAKENTYADEDEYEYEDDDSYDDEYEDDEEDIHPERPKKRRGIRAFFKRLVTISEDEDFDGDNEIDIDELSAQEFRDDFMKSDKKQSHKEPAREVIIENPQELSGENAEVFSAADSLDSESANLTPTGRIIPATEIFERAKTKTTGLGKLNRGSTAGSGNSDEIEGQFVLPGFDRFDAQPKSMSEHQAQLELSEKRKETINKFKLLDFSESIEDENDNEKQRMEEILRGKKRTRTDKGQLGEWSKISEIEFEDKKDIRRIKSYLQTLKNQATVRCVLLGILVVISLVTTLVSKARSYDLEGLGAVVVNMILLIAGAVMSIASLKRGAQNLKNGKISSDTTVLLSAVAAFIHSIVMIVLISIGEDSTCVFSGAAIFAMAVNELGKVVMFSRIISSFQTCTTREMQSLHCIEKIEDSKDAFDIAKGMMMSVPDIRYCARTLMPEKFLETSEQEGSAQQLTDAFFPIVMIAGAVIAIITGFVSESIIQGVAAFAGSICLGVPAYGLLCVQYPLLVLNRSLNKDGAAVASQKAAVDLCRTNAIMVDSSDLFDKYECMMNGYKDFETVKTGHFLLCAAAMTIKAENPLSGVFEAVIDGKNEILPQVTSLTYEEKLGMVGVINGKTVLMGNRKMLIAHNVDVPDDETEKKYAHSGRKAIYVAIDNKLSGMIIVSYEPNIDMIDPVREMVAGGTRLLVRNWDSNISAAMIAYYYGISEKDVIIISSAYGRLFKKYTSQVKETSSSDVLTGGGSLSAVRCIAESIRVRSDYKLVNLMHCLSICAGLIFMLVVSCVQSLRGISSFGLILFEIIAIALPIIIIKIKHLPAFIKNP